MPILLKLLVRHLIMGIAAGWVTLGMLMFVNIGGLRTILIASSDPVLVFILLAFGFTITFGSLAMGAAIMTLPYGGDQGKGRGLRIDNVMVQLKQGLPKTDVGLDLVPVPAKHNPE
ncbi:MAG: hypothetical protein GY927_10790 [bacterium]|nr:hypothetical protein [bacterium]